MAGAALHEIGPAGPGDETAALGFTLGLALGWAGAAGIIWAGEEGLFAEQGAPYPPGLVQFGLDPGRLIVVRTRKREQTLWAAEQGLAAPGTVVICALGRGKALDLKATRRLLLFAERNHARCLLLRPLAETSAAWTRWLVSPAPSVAHGRELGAPAYQVELTRNRAGPSGCAFTLDWNSDGRCFDQRVAGDLAAALGERSSAPIRARA
jgi:protein ImuA